MSEPEKYYISCRALINDSNRILLRKKTGDTGNVLWEAPGGRMDRKETPAETLRREVQEEIGAEVEIDELLHIDVVYDPPELKNRYSALVLWYTCRLTSGPEPTEDSSNVWEFGETKWHEMASLENINVDKWTRDAIEKLKRVNNGKA